jgi:predicted amidohydrolase YtcJ
MSRHAVVAGSIWSQSDDDAVVIEDAHVVALANHGDLGDMPVTTHPSGTILPPFTDSHIHPLGYAALVAGTSLMEARTIEDLRQLLTEAAARTPAGQAVIAQRLDDTPLGRLPTRQDLDHAIPDRPAIAYRYCGHVAVANTAALDQAGIARDTLDPTGGSLDRDRDGIPNGILRETAIDLVGDALEPLAPPLDEGQVLAAMHGLAALGIGHIGGIVAATHGLWCGVGDEIGVLVRLAPDLPIDMDLMVIAEDAQALVEAHRRLDSAGPRLRFWGWKEFADGSFGGHTAAMWEPFEDRATTGTFRLDSGHVAAMARTALGLGGVAAIHAIGDRAVDETLDLFDGLLVEGADPNRLRIEHASVVTERAIARFTATGVIASVQPAFLTSEADWVPGRLGRHRPAYRFGSMAGAGVRMLGGSDCPVERPDPLLGIAAAIQRPGWDDDEHLSPESAVELFTKQPRVHFGRPPALQPGAPADFVVVDGEVGTAHASVAAVYRRGQPIDLQPVEWPG